MLEWLAQDTLIKCVFLMYGVTLIFVMEFLVQHFFYDEYKIETEQADDYIDYDNLPEYKG